MYPGQEQILDLLTREKPKSVEACREWEGRTIEVKENIYCLDNFLIIMIENCEPGLKIFESKEFTLTNLEIVDADPDKHRSLKVEFTLEPSERHLIIAKTFNKNEPYNYSFKTKYRVSKI